MLDRHWLFFKTHFLQICLKVGFTAKKHFGLFHSLRRHCLIPLLHTGWIRGLATTGLMLTLLLPLLQMALSHTQMCKHMHRHTHRGTSRKWVIVVVFVNYCDWWWTGCLSGCKCLKLDSRDTHISGG